MNYLFCFINLIFVIATRHFIYTYNIKYFSYLLLQEEETIFNYTDFDVDTKLACDLTKGQFSAIVLAFAIKYLPLSGMTELLNILNTLEPGCVPKSKYFAEKLFFKKNATKHYYCTDCRGHLNMTNDIYSCANCELQYNNNQEKDLKYFLVRPLKEQLSKVLTFIEFPVHNMETGSRGDLLTGSLYKE